MKKEKVICYGASSAFERLFFPIKSLYEIIALSDSNCEKKAVAEKFSIPFVKPKDILNVEYEKIILTSSYEKEIKGFLVDELGIKESSIISMTEFLQEQKRCFGEKNEDKKILLLRKMDCADGMNSMLMNYLYTLEHFPDLEQYDVVIDSKNYTSIYQNDGKENILYRYFEDKSRVSLEDVYESKNVVLSNAGNLLEPDVLLEIAKMDRDICQKEDVRKYFRNLYNQYFRLNREMEKTLQEQIDQYITPVHRKGKKICAVEDRCYGYNNLKPYGHYIQPEFSETVQLLEKLRDEWGYEKILLDTIGLETEKAYKDYFGDMIISIDRTKVSENSTKIPEDETKGYRISEKRENDQFLQGKELLVSRYLLAQCDFFYSGISGSSVLPVLLGENFEDIYIYENGRFGFEAEAVMGVPRL